MVVNVTLIDIDNMLIKLNRITQEIASMAYQLKQMRREQQSIGADGYTKQAPGHLQPSVAAPPASWAEGLSILEEGV